MINRLRIDVPRVDDMQSFLNRIYDLALFHNRLMGGQIYDELCKTGLKNFDVSEDGDFIDISRLFYYWQDYYLLINNSKIHVERFPNFWQFLTFSSPNFPFNNREYIKLYIPLDRIHLKFGVQKIFDYIISQEIMHESKVSCFVRSDNVVVRLLSDDEDAAKKIIQFVLMDSFLRGGLNKTNPFVPTVNGIGFMYESGISYNAEMAYLFYMYIKNCVSKNFVPNVSHFCEWFKRNNQSVEVANIFETLNIKDYISNGQAYAKKLWKQD